MTSTSLTHVDYARELEAASDPAQAVVAALESAHTWLAQAIAEGKGDHIAEFKSKAHGILAYIRQKELGQEAELAGAEIIRRAERAIGIVIEQGQDNGSIRDRGRPKENADTERISSTSDYVCNTRERWAVGVFATITDEDFETAIARARDEGRLTRTNVLRILGHEYGPAPRKKAAPRDADESRGKDSPNYKKRHLKADRMVAETVTTLDGVCSVLNMTKVAQLNPEMVEEWATSLTKSVNRISRFIKEMTHVER